MIRRKSPPSENIHFIVNQCQTNIYKGRRGNDFNTFFMNEIKFSLYTCHYDITKIFYII